MTQEQSPPEVVDDIANQRFVAVIDGSMARLDYELDGGRLILVHTEVPQQLGGRGLGGQLVQAGVARAVRDGLTLAPWCPYARKWPSVRIDWSEPPGRS
jgi:predicted GNAT family acetyltransferase